MRYLTTSLLLCIVAHGDAAAQSETRMREMFSVKTKGTVLLVAARSDGTIQFTSADVATRHDCLVDTKRARTWGAAAENVRSRTIAVNPGESVESISPAIDFGCNAVLVRMTTSNERRLSVRHIESRYPIVTPLDSTQAEALIHSMLLAADSADAMRARGEGSREEMTSYFDFQVDTPATITQRAKSDRCARGQKQHGEAESLVQFVLDTLGRPDNSSFKVLSTTDSAFNDSTRSIVRGMSFRPARLHGRSVQQLVQTVVIVPICR